MTQNGKKKNLFLFLLLSMNYSMVVTSAASLVDVPFKAALCSFA